MDILDTERLDYLGFDGRTFDMLLNLKGLVHDPDKGEAEFIELCLTKMEDAAKEYAARRVRHLGILLCNYVMRAFDNPAYEKDFCDFANTALYFYEIDQKTSLSELADRVLLMSSANYINEFGELEDVFDYRNNRNLQDIVRTAGDVRRSISSVMNGGRNSRNDYDNRGRDNRRGPSERMSVGGFGTSGLRNNNQEKRGERGGSTTTNTNTGSTWGRASDAPVEKEVAVKEEVVEVPKDVTWKRSDSQLYYKAYDPVMFVSGLTKNRSGVVEQTINLRQLGDEMEFDYKAHSLSPVWKVHPNPVIRVDDDGRGTEVKFSVTKAARYQADPERSTFDAYVVSDKEFLDINLNNIALSSVFARHTLPTTPEVYRRYGTLATVISLDDGEVGTAVLDHLANCGTFSAIQKVMLEAKKVGKYRIRNKSGANEDVEVSQAFSYNLNKYLTEYINGRLIKTLSVTEVEMNSFCDDWEELAGYIKNHYNEETFNLFTANEKLDIESIFTAPDEEMVKTLKLTYVDGDDETASTPDITVIYEHCSITLLNMYYTDLRIELDTEKASLLSSTYSSVLYSVAKSLFEELKQQTQNRTLRHYVYLNEGVMIELTEGDLVEDSYLATLIK